jgi:hypothetical protein
MLSVQILQKDTYFYETGNERRHKHVEMLNQDSDNQDEMNYIPKNTHEDE